MLLSGSKAYEELEKVVKCRLLMTDIEKISPAELTSGLEVIHKVLSHFASKSAPLLCTYGKKGKILGLKQKHLIFLAMIYEL